MIEIHDEEDMYKNIDILNGLEEFSVKISNLYSTQGGIQFYKEKGCMAPLCNRYRKHLQKGGKFPPIEIQWLTLKARNFFQKKHQESICFNRNKNETPKVYDNHKFLICDGHHRWAAHKLEKKKYINAILV